MVQRVFSATLAQSSFVVPSPRPTGVVIATTSKPIPLISGGGIACGENGSSNGGGVGAAAVASAVAGALAESRHQPANADPLSQSARLVDFNVDFAANGSDHALSLG